MKNTENVKIAVGALDEKKAFDIQVIDIGDLSILGDFLVIATGTSTTHVNALADEVEFKLSEKGLEPSHIEGRNTPWVLLDYGDMMVHVFMRDARNFYALERLWSDGKQLDTKDFM